MTLFNIREPMTDRVMPLGLQKHTILKVFNRLNPDAEPDDLDWDHLDGKCSFAENLWNMKQGHPRYVWDEPLDEYDIDRMEMGRVLQEKYDQIGILLAKGLDEDAAKVSKEMDEIEERFNKKFDTGWHMEKIEGGEMHTIEVEIKLRPVFRNGKKYPYGRIQINDIKTFFSD